MPDAKSLLPGRAFRSEHAQLRPEPHSIASHGPAPMDPLQTTRMRNGVLYAAEWPCCHDPLRLSLGSEDPFYTITTHAFGARGCATPPPLFGCVAVGAPAARAECVRLPRARGGVRPTPSQNPCLLFPCINPAAARALPSARARRGCLASTRVCPSLHITPPLAPRSTLPLRTALPNPSRPPLPCVLPPCPPQTPPSTPAMCPSRPRRHWPHLSLVRAPRPPAHLPAHACTAPQLPRAETAPPPQGGGLGLARPPPPPRTPRPPAPPPPTTNRAAGSTPAARTPPTN
jgi:hypothetical protein